MARLEIDIVGNNTELKKILADSKIALSQFQKEVSGGKGALVELNQVTKGTQTSLEAQAIALSKAKTATQQARQASAELTLANRQNKQQVDGATGSYRQAQMQLTAMGKAIREAGNGFDLTSPKVRKAVNEYNALNNKLKEFDKAMGNNQRNVGNYGSAFASAIPYVGQFTGAMGAATAGFAALQKSFTTNLQLDALKTALKNISGDTETFNANMDFLRATSERLGLEFVSTANAFKMWQGAAKFSNLTAEESRSIFESVANAGAKMKLSSDQVSGAFLALSQMMSKGKVQAEELRGQLGERLPGAFALAAKAMGVTEMELNKMLETGQVVAQDFLPKFAKQLDISFGNDKTQKIESMQASVSRLSNAFTELFNSEGATDFFTVVIDGTSEVVRSLGKINEPISKDSFLGMLMGGGNKGIGANIKGSLDEIIRNMYDRFIQGSGRAGGSIRVNPKLNTGFNPFGANNAPDLGMFPAYDTSKISLTTKDVNKQADAILKNKQYWDEQAKSIRGSIEAMDSSLIGSARYLELQKQLGVAEAQSNAYKAITKTQLNDIKRSQEEYNKAVSEVTKGALSQYDKKLFDITDKYNKLYNIIGKTSEKGLLAQQNEEAEKLRVSAEKLEDIFTRIKSASSGLKASDLNNASGGNINIPSLDNLTNSSAGKKAGDRLMPDFTDKDLEKRLSKVVERGMRRGIEDIFGDIDKLGSNFQEVFSNVFQKLSKSVTGIFQSVLATQLGELLSSKINKDDFKIGDFGAVKSKALVAGIGTAGSLISGLTSKKSVAGQALGGAASGAAAGLAFGGYGAIVGAVIGGLAGMFSAQQANKQSKIQEEMLKEQRKQTALQDRANALAYTASIIGQQTTAGIVTGVDRNAFGEITFRVGGRDLVAVLGNEENAQKRGL